MTTAMAHTPAWVIGHSLDVVNAIATVDWGWTHGYDKARGRHHWIDHEGRDVFYAPRFERLVGMPVGDGVHRERTRLYVSRTWQPGNDYSVSRSAELHLMQMYAKKQGFEIIEAWPEAPWVRSSSSEQPETNPVAGDASSLDNLADNSAAPATPADAPRSSPVDRRDHSSDGPDAGVSKAIVITVLKK